MRIGRLLLVMWLAAITVPVMAQVGTWDRALPMSSGRYAPTATLLTNGKVLVAGGYNGAVTVPTAELFDPTTGTWSPTGPFSDGIGRNFATATLLDSEKVLIAGGFNDVFGSLSSAELYDPLTGTFSKVPFAMTSRRELFTATKLPDGQVLLVGGFRTGFGGGTLRTAEIYNPATGRFTSTGSMLTAYGRFGHDAILLPGGQKVLIVGGKERRSNTDWRSLATTEIYDIATGRFNSGPTMKHRRDRPAVALVGGRVLIVGGKSEARGTTPYNPKPTEWFDPGTGKLSDGPSLISGRMAFTLTALPGGEWLAVGGWAEEQGSTTATAERLVLANGAHRFVDAGSTFHSSHDHAAAPLLGGSVLVAGGKSVDSTGTTYLPDAAIYTR